MHKIDLKPLLDREGARGAPVLACCRPPANAANGYKKYRPHHVQWVFS
jgi:hypothetical protein